MYSPNPLPFIVPLLISAAASIGGAAVSAKISKAGRQEPDWGALAQAEEEKQKQMIIYIAGGAVLLIFIFAAMRQ